jgi:hypothetical protein
MSTLERAVNVISEAEASLRRMIGEAAEGGDYSAVQVLVGWASQLHELCEHPSASATSYDLCVKDVAAKTNTPNDVRQPKVRSKSNSYPFFEKCGDNLVKIGWSKSSRSQYQHKSPRIVARKLAEALSREAKQGGIIATEKLMPVKLDDGSLVPDYQVYVSLAWFRQIGVVKQNGRQGYTVRKPNDLGKLIEAAWSDLSEVRPS